MIKNSIKVPDERKIVTVLLGQSIAKHIEKTDLVGLYQHVYRLPVKQGEAFLFKYAVMVFWGVPTTEREQFIKAIMPYVLEPAPSRVTDLYRYQIDTDAGFRVKNDCLFLPNKDPLTYLGLSHALAQSAKLIFFEDKAEAVIAQNLSIPKRLAKTGKISLRRRSLAKLRGILFDTSCDITLNFNLLDKPNLFWDFPEKDDEYVTLLKYLEMSQRIELLNHKLSMIHELLDMLAEEQNHKHSSFLEWIIIVLIATEIILYFFK